MNLPGPIFDVLTRAESMEAPLTPWILPEEDDELTARSWAWQIVTARAAEEARW